MSLLCKLGFHRWQTVWRGTIPFKDVAYRYCTEKDCKAEKDRTLPKLSGEMVSAKVCGRIFNRHKWHYLDRASRVCRKCGESQARLYTSTVNGGFYFWSKRTFEELQKEVGERFQHESAEEKMERESRKKALDWMGGK